MNEISSTGQLLRRLRERARMSQPDVERKGGPKQSLQSRIERGEVKTLTDETTRAYALAFGMSFERLRERFQSLETGEADEPLRMGFIHGISAAPIIAMLMGCQLGSIATASMVDSDGEWNWSGQERIHPGRLGSHGGWTGFNTHLLHENLDRLDLLVAPSDSNLLKDEWNTESGPLLRYAQISSQSAFDFVVFARLSEGETAIPAGGGSAISPDGNAPASPLAQWRKINVKHKDLPVKIYYPPETLGENYAGQLVDSDLQPSILEPFSGDIQKFIENLLAQSESFVFRAIVPFPLSSIVEDLAKSVGWRAEAEEVVKIFEEEGKSLDSIPQYSIDILLRRDRTAVIEWLGSDEYDRFSEQLADYENRLSSGALLPLNAIVRGIADYLGINAARCADKLRECRFDFMHYPEFTRFILNVRTRRNL